jgi:LytS/YehU family sensor histidine kinase
VVPNQQFYVYGSIVLPYCSALPSWRTYVDFPGSVVTPLVIGAMVMIVVFGRRRDAELVAALHKTRAAQVEAHRQRIESDIEAMQSRVDPDVLFSTLAEIRARYETSAAAGEALLDELIGTLRQAARGPAIERAPQAP